MGLLDLPLTAPPLAELLSTNRRTLLLLNSNFHSHLTSTIARSSIWQMSWSPSIPFHRLSRSSRTWSWTTKRHPVDSSSRTAPKPAPPFSQGPSVNTNKVRLLMLTRIVLGLTLLSRRRTSSRQFRSWGALGLPLSTKEKILKHAYFKDLPTKYPAAKFKRPCISCASEMCMTPASFTLSIVEEILSTLPSFFQGDRVVISQPRQVQSHA